MKDSKPTLRSLITAGLCAAFILGAAVSTQAEDKKADASGTWTWTSPGRNGGPDRKNTLKLKVDGDKVTGTIASVAGDQAAPDTEISDGKVKGDEISFTVTREFNGNKFTQKYNGKISGDSITGKVERDRGGQTTSSDWEAKRKS
jgi:hypothetical protein